MEDATVDFVHDVENVCLDEKSGGNSLSTTPTVSLNGKYLLIFYDWKPLQ